MSVLEQVKTPYLIAVGLVIIGLVMGYILGSSSTEANKHIDKKEHLAKTKKPDEKKEEVSLDTEASSITQRARLEGKNEGHPRSKENLYKMSEGINELVRLVNADGAYDFKGVNILKQDLLNLAKNDKAALDELLVAYADNLNNDRVQDLLFQVVSEVKDPKVEALATELALSSDRDERIAGFDLLGELQIPSEKNLELSMQALEQEQNDKELVLSALHALPKISLSQEDNAEVVGLLSELATNDNEAIRSESLIGIASWAKTQEELGAVVQALDSKTVDDRISAAMALEQSTVVGDDLKLSLLAKIEDDNEVWEVRSMSANALERFDLSSSEFASLQEYKKKQLGGVAN